MKPIFDINSFRTEENDRYVMHCSTRDDAQTFFEYLNEIGETWCTGESYLQFTPWDVNRVYYFNKGQQGTRALARDYDYTVLEFSDFEWANALPDSEIDPEDEESFSGFISLFVN